MSVTISITGGMNLCAESTDRFSGGLPRITAAVATAVVSKPAPKNTTGSVVERDINDLRHAVDHINPCAGRACVCRRPAEPGTRTMSPWVAMRTPLSASATASSISACQ